MAVLAVDIGGTRTRALLLREPPDAGPKGTPPRPVEMAARAAGQALQLSDLLAFLGTYRDGKQESLEAIGVSVAGVLDDDRRTVRQALNVGWRDVPLQAALDDRFRCPVVLDTDAFAAARAELRLGAGRRHSTFLYVTIGTGIGHALVLDGRLWRGVHGAASTFGHLKSHADADVPCACGGHGCLCQYASGRGMARLAARPEEGRRRHDGAAIVAAAAHGEPWAQEVVDAAHEALAVALSHALTVVDCGAVVIGGGAASRRWPDPDHLRGRVAKLVHPQVRIEEIATSKLTHAALLGAALQAFDRVRSGGNDPMSEEGP